MPTYDYECTKCGHAFEEFQKMSDPVLTDCPACKGHGTVKRLIGAGAGLIFKGSGFYITDYKHSHSSGSSSKSEAPKCEKADSKSEGCANCPAAKAE